MNNDTKRLIDALNADELKTRLKSIKKLKGMVKKGLLPSVIKKGLVNNHIHTWYSFSPYSPAKAVWQAFAAGLNTAGIVDHDTAEGASEFIEAGKTAGLPTTTGMECRTDFSGTPLKGKRINHPDQNSTAYVVIHGIPRRNLKRVNQFFKPCIDERIKRTEKMTERINDFFKKWDIALDFYEDVLSASKFKEGGTVTERHMLFALAEKLIIRFGKGNKLVDFLKGSLRIKPEGKLFNFLIDAGNPYYTYDLMGILKSGLLKKFYIRAEAECPEVSRVVDFANEINAIPAYAYLGDIEESITGDKKAQEFEDSYLEDLFAVLKESGFKAVTYMPTRNSSEQIARVRDLCVRYNFLRISGEDINSPRQSFTGKAVAQGSFGNLVETTWALIGHETEAGEDPEKSFFSPKTVNKYPDLEERIKVYADIGRKQQKPEEV
ncbi:MAG: PHP domain-containing protein [Spirochaetes bacterium]|nr:PHP domain-containing protein [Spirochaetota bacterium]